MSWKMFSHTHFEYNKLGFKGVLKVNGVFGWNAWDIIKDGVIIDCAFYHTPTSGELQGKVQIEKIISTLITQTPGQ